MKGKHTMENKNITILVERETYEKNGKSYYSYFIKGELRGKEFRLSVIPHDIGGYTVLDIVFGNAMAAELVITPFEIKDDATGRNISGNSLSVVSYDENGESYECPVKPARKSDKALLNMLMKSLGLNA